MSFEKLADELAIEKGYLIKEYPSKWKQAKDAAIRMDKSEYGLGEDSAFSVACRLFLELGGKRNLKTVGFWL